MWVDDSNLIRLCSVFQSRGDVANIDPYDQELNNDDRLTFYAYIYAMRVTGNPQMLGVFQNGNPAGHAVLVYRIKGDTMYVADPNFHGEEHLIQFSPGNGGQGAEILPYLSGANSWEAVHGTLYDEFLFMGDFAWVNEQVLFENYRKLFQNQKIGISEFEDDMFGNFRDVDIVVGADENGGMVSKKLKDHLNLKPQHMNGIEGYSSDSLILKKAPSAAAGRQTVYIGDTMYKELTTEWSEITTLKPGKNDVGILVELQYSDGKYEYYDFVRYNVIYGDGVEEVTETSETVEVLMPLMDPVGEWTEIGVAEIWFREDAFEPNQYKYNKEDVDNGEIRIQHMIDENYTDTPWIFTFSSDGTAMETNVGEMTEDWYYTYEVEEHSGKFPYIISFWDSDGDISHGLVDREGRLYYSDSLDTFNGSRIYQKNE